MRALLACALLASGCFDIDGLTQLYRPDAAVDLSVVTDAPLPNPDGTVESCPGNLIMDPSFEAPAGSSRWVQGGNATFTRSTDARSGLTAAQVCAVTPTDTWFLNYDTLVALTPNASYTLTGWIKIPTGNQLESRLALQPYSGDGGIPSTPYIQSTKATATSTWTQVTATVTAGGSPDENELIYLFAYQVGAPGDGCVLLDDVCLLKQ